MRSDQTGPLVPAQPSPPGSAWSLHKLGATEEDRARRERLLDQALADTFPASDPVSVTAPYQGFGNG